MNNTKKYMKQSSIEWYLEQINILDYRYNGKSITLGEYVNEKNRLELKAKEIHKQEIIEAREDGFDSTYAEYGETPKCYLDGSSEKYYVETFLEKENE